VHLLRRNDTLAAALADLVAMLGGPEYQQTKAVGDVIREIGSVNARDAGANKAFATFLPELAQRCPALVLGNVSLLVAHLDSESYTMRNGVVQVRVL
jgi:condensin complex subunit 1